jgi:iron complex outermembrane receptor protein
MMRGEGRPVRGREACMKQVLGAAALLWAAGAGWAQSPPRLEEVEVTAQRRVESARRAALPVSVLAPEALRAAGVSKPQELTELVPSLQVAASAAPISVFYLRGAGNFTGNALTDSAVAFNVDGVSIGRPHATAGFFHDLERIEVLKGPQGTLYGRNATGGAINVLSRRPEIGRWGGEAGAEAGNEGHARIDGIVNVPLGGRAALRAAAYHAGHDGWTSDGADDQDDTAGRLSFLLEPGDALSVRVVADYFDQSGRGTGSTPVALGPGRRYGISSPESGAFYESQPNFIAGRSFNEMPPTQRLDNHFWGVGATIDWKTAAGTLTVLPAYREGDLDTVGTALGVNVTTLEEDRQKSLEARFASELAGRLDYIVGAYWFDETNRIPLFVPNTQYSMSVQDYDTGVESAAAFGQLTFELTGGLRATAGARYTDEKKFFRGTFDGAVRLCLPPVVGACPDLERFSVTQLTPPPADLDPSDGNLTVLSRIDSDEVESFSKWTWRAALDWDAGEGSFFYLSYETGFKSGGFFFSSDTQVFQPEELAAVTLGSKNRLLDDRLRLDVEVFHWRYDDQQVSTIMRDSRNVTNLGTRNVGQVTMKGIEVGTEWLVGDSTRLRADAQYLDATYDDFRYDVPTFPVSGCAVSPGGAGFLVDCSGKRAPYAPEWTLNLGVEQAFELAGGRLVAEARLRYQSETLTGLDFTPLEYQGDATTLGASLTYTTAGERYYVTAFGNNLTDETLVANSFQPPFGAFVVGTLRPPRLYGLRLGTRF